MSTSITRRQWLAATLSGAAALRIGAHAQTPGWNAGSIRHLLPGVGHDRLLLKASFVRPLEAPPSLRIESRRARGVRMDTTGEFYSFDFSGLEPEHTYQLVLEDDRRRAVIPGR